MSKKSLIVAEPETQISVVDDATIRLLACERSPGAKKAASVRLIPPPVHAWHFRGFIIRERV